MWSTEWKNKGLRLLQTSKLDLDLQNDMRNFSQEILKLFQVKIKQDWQNKYFDKVLGFETLIELPRTGEIYKRNKWELVGQTIGYTCKRVAGKGTDSWSGKRVWDTENLRPKLVFVKAA